MADIVQNVIVDFQVDYSQLINAQEQLAKGGNVDAKGFEAIGKAISTTSKDTKGLIQDFKKVAGTAISLGKSVEDAFGAGVQDALDQAGVSAEEFGAALKKANAPAKSLKAELRELKIALAQAKLSGKDTGAEFESLRARAGALSDAIADANAEINNAGSDTRNLDNVVGSISALAGGFAAAQGAAALFGDESEDMQKVLVKVNAAMALASGLQQFYTATLKEGALTKLADSIATKSQSAATLIYTFVTNGATVATKLLRAAIIATGIGALVVLVVALVQAMSSYGKETESAADAQQRLADATNAMNAAAEQQIESLTYDIKLRKLRAEAAGASEDELTKIETDAIKQRIAIRQKEIDFAIKNGLSISELAKQNSEDIQALAIAELDAQIKANKLAEDKIKKQNDLKSKDAAEAKAKRARQLQDELAALQRQLLNVEKGSQAEIEFLKQIVAKKAQIELNAEKLKANQIALIKETSLNDQVQLQIKFNEKATEQQLKAQIDTNTAILTGVKITGEERERLLIENINTTAQLEINGAEGNAAKILLIEAEKQAKIRVIRNAAIDAQLAEDLRSVELTNTIIKDALAKQASDYTKSKDARISALRAIEAIELTAVDKAIEANEKRIQSDEDYIKRYNELMDQKAAINYATNQKIASDDQAENKAREERLKKTATNYIAVANQIADFYSSLSALAAEQDRQRIEQQKNQLQSLVEAGAITAKQAKIRAQEIEIAERKAKQAAAQREKQAAVFKAVLAIPTAFLQGLSQGGIYLAAIYAALAAAQAAVVIAKPVPKFFRGKKDKYEGPGIVADMGSEIVERNGRMYLYTDPTQTYLKANDKVYNAGETRQILHNSNVNTTITQPKAEKIDYARFAKAIKPSNVNINIEKDFISEAVADGLGKVNYFNKRYSKW